MSNDNFQLDESIIGGYRFEGAGSARFELRKCPYQNEKQIAYLEVHSGTKKVTTKFASLGINEIRRLIVELQCRIDDYYQAMETWRIHDKKTGQYVLADLVDPALNVPMRFDRIDDAENFVKAMYEAEQRDAGEHLSLHRFYQDRFTGDSIAM